MEEESISDDNEPKIQKLEVLQNLINSYNTFYELLIRKSTRNLSQDENELYMNHLDIVNQYSKKYNIEIYDKEELLEENIKNIFYITKLLLNKIGIIEIYLLENKGSSLSSSYLPIK
jgi:hypothetical protein